MSQAIHGQFNSITKTYFNSVTGKWVKRIRPSQKGNSALKKWNELGCKKKSLFVPVNTDVSLLKATAVTNSLNYEHMLFILHKLLYNRLLFKKGNKPSLDFLNNYTPLGSEDLRRWLGKDYHKSLKALCDIEYIIPKLTSRGTKSYFHGGSKNSKTAIFKINPKLFNYDLFEQLSFFKKIELNDVRLTVKLTKQHQTNSVDGQPIHTLLKKALNGVRVNALNESLYKNHLPETVQEMLLLIDQINSGDIYIKPELDNYGERFHSTFTFTWSSIRPLIYFENKPGRTTYLDLKNSQYFFFSLLGLPQTYQLLPEYLELLPVFEKHEVQLIEFNAHSQSGTLYDWCSDVYNFSKLNLMQLFFGKSTQFAKKRKKLPWLTEILVEIERIYSYNIIPSVLQKLESRTMLNKICFTFLSNNKGANLISIHDGILFEERYFDEIVCTIQETFDSLNLPVPRFKISQYSSWPELNNNII